jgi:TatD DNase family protein
MSAENPLPTVKSGAVDTHCHLFLLDREPSDVVQAASVAGVDRIVSVGIDPETSRRSLELADALPGVFATAGLHPNDAGRYADAAGATLEELLHDPLVVAVGETGLDFFRDSATQADQERLFRLHIHLSRDSGKPLVVHCREAWPSVLRLLDEGSADRVVLHCFSGDVAVARECERRGYFLSFAANITYPANAHLRDASASVGLDRLLVESDSPYLPPRSRRGRPNAPEYLGDTLAALAAARGEDVETVRDATSRTARAVFPRLGEWEIGS